MARDLGGAPVLAGPVFVDAHVHLHRCFDLAASLSAAAGNVSRAARLVTTAGDHAIGVLLLAEGRNEGAFGRLRSASASAAGPWTIHPSAEPESLLLRESGILRLIVIAGQQVVTTEGIEVLGLLSVSPIADGRTLAETVELLRQHGAVPVLPWGFGKWTMRRGALVASFLRAHPREIYLGDNGGRLAGGRMPPLLDEARRLAVPILPGSDPLPFADQLERLGSYGLVADAALTAERPAAGLRLWLRGLTGQPPTYGKRETLGRFCWNQARMQWRKRLVRAE